MVEIIGKFIKVIGNILFITLLIVMSIIGISLFPLPKNYKIYSVATGSMSPTIKTNSLILVKPLKEYQVNDIVTINTAESRKTITHRIVGKINKNNQIIFETKGDANKSKDLENLKPQNIVGKVFFVIPYLGLPIIYSKTLPGLIFLIIIPATIIIYSEIVNIKNELINLLSKKPTFAKKASVGKKKNKS
ncbi:signal peptidase I [Candidatus Roizmanbacteria bacterium]|nr:signal peptidase I [Candidatus Roizmanbacteria bacterium]